MRFQVFDQLVRPAAALGGPGRGSDLGPTLDPQTVTDSQVRGVQPLGQERRDQQKLGMQTEGDDLAVAQLARDDARQESRQLRLAAHASPILSPCSLSTPMVRT